MAETLFAPVPITYIGLYADAHLVDAQQLGKSLIGASKLANSACHFLFSEQVTSDPRKFQIRFYAGPSKQNGLLQEIVALANNGLLPIFPKILMTTGGFMVEKLMEAAIKFSLNRKSEGEVAVEAIKELALKHEEFAQNVHQGHMRDKAWLQDHIDRLASENRGALRELPEPVGKSVRQMHIGPKRGGLIIDEAAADALRSKEDLEVGDATEFVIEVEGVFKTDGNCRLKLVDSGAIVSGRITDPALFQDHNIYTSALDGGFLLKVTAKPTLKDGRIIKLFVSDAARAA